MKILDIVHDSIVDGIGLRTVIFFAGCPHKCKNCHNPESWDINNGYDITKEQIIEEIKNNPITQGITLSGGDPFYQAEEVKELAKELKTLSYNIWIYTGYTFEEIYYGDDKSAKELLELCDVLIDSKYIDELKDLRLAFKGSSNQRIIDIQETIKNNKIIELNY